MQGVSGSVTQLDRVGPQSATFDAAANAANEQALRIRHSEPTMFEGAQARGDDADGRYNRQAALPAKYSVQSEFKDHLNVTNDLMSALSVPRSAGGAGARDT